MTTSETGDQMSVSPAKTHPVVLGKPQLLQWMVTPGSALQAMALVGVVVVVGQLLFGSITLTAAIAEFSGLVLLGLTLPPIFRATVGRTRGTHGPG